MDISIVGGGIGGLTLALMLHATGRPCRVFETAPEIRPVGVGINLLPHAMKELAGLGLQPALEARAVTTSAAAFYNRFGQLIYSEPLGRFAGYPWPQLSIHRADLQAVLVEAFVERIGADRLHLGHRAMGFEEDALGVRLHLQAATGASLPAHPADALIGADGIHSAIRRQLFPDEGPPRYSGVNMWRGVVSGARILNGSTMIRAGWLATGKMVIYPIRNEPDGSGRQLINWVAEIETPTYNRQDWTRAGRLEDFAHAFADWHFDWLDVPALLRGTREILEYPMVDRDPLPRWSFGRVTLLGDAAHPMVPRGSNGAGQAILDARALADALASTPGEPVAALATYEAVRREATSRVVLTNRSAPPDAIIGEVYRRTGDKPFRHIDEVISREELVALSDGYKKVAGYDKQALAANNRES
ncbi:MAG TPA: flavin-dependent oxidoreductase [Burkholderiales bacterium]